MVNPIEIEGFRTPGHTIHDVTLRDCTLPQDASIRLALYDELSLQNIHSAAELNKQKSRYGTNLNSTPFVRQYDILSNKWGVLLCQKEYQTNDIRRNSREWL